MVHRHAATRRLVTHVQAQRQRQFHLGQLDGEQQDAAQVLGIPDLQHAAITAVQQNVAGDLLVLGGGNQRVGSRCVHGIAAAPAPHGAGGEPAAADLHGGAGIVGDRDVGAGEPAEEDALADVGIAHQDEVPGSMGFSFGRPGQRR